MKVDAHGQLRNGHAQLRGQEEDPSAHVLFEHEAQNRAEKVGDSDDQCTIVRVNTRFCLLKDQSGVESNGALAGKLEQKHQNQDDQEGVQHGLLEHITKPKLLVRGPAKLNCITKRPFTSSFEGKGWSISNVTN